LLASALPGASSTSAASAPTLTHLVQRREQAGGVAIGAGGGIVPVVCRQGRAGKQTGCGKPPSIMREGGMGEAGRKAGTK
jgi:hypothetical protein